MGQSKHRKGGSKVRKTAPTRRLNSTLDRFSRASNQRTNSRAGREERVKKGVAEGILEPMSGSDFFHYTHKCKVAPPDPKKIARLLMPNASF